MDAEINVGGTTFPHKQGGNCLIAGSALPFTAPGYLQMVNQSEVNSYTNQLVHFYPGSVSRLTKPNKPKRVL